MKRATVLLVGFLAPIVGGCTQPSDLYQRATVSLVDERLCVSVSTDSGRPSASIRLAGLTLSQMSGGRAEPIWDLDFTGAPKPFVITPGDCIFPRTPHGEGVTEKLLRNPVPGDHYSLSIMGAVATGEPEGDGWSSRLYRENFCLKSGATGASVVSVPWGAGRPRWEVCDE